MRKSILLGMICLFAGAAVSAQEIHFDTGAAKAILSPKSKLSGCEIEPTEFDGKNALRIDFNCSESLNCEFGFPPGNQVLLKDPVPKIVVKVDVFLQENNKASRLCLRLQDSGNEVFQYRATLPSGTKGWTTITYEINPEGKQPESWGDAKNRQLDWPIRIFGFSVGGFEKNPEGVGFIGLGPIAIIMGDKE